MLMARHAIIGREMSENIKLMNIQSNFESRNAMATKHSDCPNVFAIRNGLMKSASTSSCCADEKILLKKLQSSYFKNVVDRNGGNEDERKLRMLQSLSRSEQNMQLLSSEEIAAKRAIHHKSSRYSNSKHFSDCDFDDVRRRCSELQNLSSKYEEFNTHRKLDNVLTNNNSSIINFTAINDLKSHRKIDEMPRNIVSSDSSHENSEYAKTSNSENSYESQQLCAEFEKLNVSSSQRESPVREDEQVTVEEKESKQSMGENDDEKKDEKRFRRSSSLKTPKEASSNPAQKKIVRFADAMGLDLADVRTFLDELPSVPKSAYDDLRSEDVATSEPIGRLFPPLAMSNAKSLVPMFKQPGISLNFLDRVRDNFVCLENAVVCETPVCSITGTVRVRNIDFHKSVYVRYSSDNWRTLTEVQAVYVPDSCDGFSDKFSFIIYLYHVPPSQRIELAVRFHCKGSIHWDNNYGANYVFQSFALPPTIPSYFQCFPNTTERCHSFY